MQTTEINGFLIDEFNQYGLKEGKTQGICPLCSHDRQPKNQKAQCASYDWERGLGTCHNCSTSFQLHTYQRKGASEKEYVRPTSPPADEWNIPQTKVAEWFKTRGISAQTLIDLKISEGPEYMPQTGKTENTIKFNYFMGDQLINVKYRDGRKNFKLYKGAEKVFYNINSIVGYDTCIITEGEMDVLALHEAGIKNAISVPNGATLTNNNLDYLDNCIDYFEDKEKVILAVDQDDAGQMLQQELIRRLGAEVCFLVTFEDCKDANEYLLKYGKEKLAERITKARPVPLENVTTFKDIEDEVTDFVKNGFKPGYQIGLQNFDDIFSTYTGQFITVTGIPSSGKSDFVDQMVVGYNANYGWKTAFASPENAPTYLHAHKLMRKTWGDMPTRSDIGGGKWNQVAEHVNDNYFFIDMDKYSLESVLRKGAELVKRKGIKCLVIDPFNKIRDIDCKTEDVNRYTMEYLTKIEMFCKKYDVLTFIVAHPTKMYKDSNGKIEEPTMYNIKGGGEWYDASYHGILVHRDYEAKTVKAKILKVKFQNLGENGAEAHFKWEPKSGRFIPHVLPGMAEGEKMPWE
ncbi:MAG: toprim domain-containing protein [Aliivibrio sp.]|nr:toprim domain-containing protein [Aliivibrio sp.]MCP4326410.1 toprim domain-containing protein [Alteromonadales bacterium]